MCCCLPWEIQLLWLCTVPTFICQVLTCPVTVSSHASFCRGIPLFVFLYLSLLAIEPLYGENTHVKPFPWDTWTTKVAWERPAGVTYQHILILPFVLHAIFHIKSMRFSILKAYFCSQYEYKTCIFQLLSKRWLHSQNSFSSLNIIKS